MQSNHAKDMVCLRGLLIAFLSGHLAYEVSTLIMVLTLIVFAVWLNYWRQCISLPWAMALSILLALLFSNHTYFHDYLLLTVPAVLILPSVSMGQLLSITDRYYRWLCLLFHSYPLWGWLAFSFVIRQCEIITLIPYPVVAAQFLLVVLAVLAVRHKASKMVHV
jgi:hypothetical protein